MTLTKDDPRIYEARKQAIRMASELCRPFGGNWGHTILRDDNVIVLCGEKRLGAYAGDCQGFTVYVTPGTNATQYTLDS